MYCPKCNTAMVCLFISYVCDKCNPPNVAVKAEVKQNNKDGLYYGYVVFEKDYNFLDFLKSGRTVSKFVYKTKEEAESSWIATNMSKAEIYKVVSRAEIDYARPDAKTHAPRIQIIDRNFWEKNKEVAKGFVAPVD